MYRFKYVSTQTSNYVFLCVTRVRRLCSPHCEPEAIYDQRPRNRIPCIFEFDKFYIHTMIAQSYKWSHGMGNVNVLCTSFGSLWIDFEAGEYFDWRLVMSCWLCVGCTKFSFLVYCEKGGIWR